MRKIMLALIAAPLLAHGAFAQPVTDYVYQPDRYAMVAIRNASNIRITYWYRWGNQGSWSSKTLNPGASWWHSWEYAPGSEGYSPDFQVSWVRWPRHSEPLYDYESLQKYRAPAQEYRYAKEHVFNYTTVRGGSGSHSFVSLLGSN